MAVLLEPGALFVHIPRTGGASIRSVLYATGRADEHRHVHAGYDDIAEVHQARRCFTIVRNPFERLVSMMLFQSEDLDTDPAETLWRYLNTVPAFPALDHWRNQTSYVGAGELLIGRYERLEQDWQRIAGEFDLPTALPRLNVSRSDPYDYRQFYRQDSYDWVLQHHAADLTRFGYAFGDGNVNFT
jgi:Sulfotransferase family